MDPHGSSDPWPSALHCLALLYRREREKRGAQEAHNRTFESKNIKKAAGKVSTFCQRQPEIGTKNTNSYLCDFIFNCNGSFLASCVLSTLWSLCHKEDLYPLLSLRPEHDSKRENFKK